MTRVRMLEFPYRYTLDEQLINLFESLAAALGNAEQAQQDRQERSRAKDETDAGMESCVLVLQEVWNAERDGELDEDVED